MNVRQRARALHERLSSWWRRVNPFGWTTVLDTGITLYQQRTSGERRVVVGPKFGVGYQPIDWHWVRTGEWSNWGGDVPTPRTRCALPAP